MPTYHYVKGSAYTGPTGSHRVLGVVISLIVFKKYALPA